VFRRACSADVCIMNSGTFRCVRVWCVCMGGGVRGVCVRGCGQRNVVRSGLGRLSRVQVAHQQLLQHYTLTASLPCLPPIAAGTHTRSDTVHPAGPLTYRDLLNILPMLDDTVVLKVGGEGAGG
jgi:hypothetical protein